MTRIKTNFVSYNRNWVTVKRHLPIVIKPLIASMIVVAIWRFIFFPNNIYFNKFAAEPIMFIILPLVAFIYVIFAGIATTSVFDQYKMISKCVVKKDLDNFLIYRDEQLPIMMHFLIAVPTLILITFVMLFNFEGHVFIAMATLFSVVFMLVLIWVIAAELDDFKKSIWFKAKIPKEWFEIDIDEYFKNK